MEEVFLSMSPIIKQNLSLGVQIDSQSVLFFPILLRRVNNEKEWLDFIKKSVLEKRSVLYAKEPCQFWGMYFRISTVCCCYIHLF